MDHDLNLHHPELNKQNSINNYIHKVMKSRLNIERTMLYQTDIA
jgi:hypothetical protein